MDAEVEARYQQAITELGVRKRWYQTATDLYYAAVVAAVDRLTTAEIQARSSLLDESLPPTHDLHLIKQTLAAVTASRGLDVATYVATVDEVAEDLRTAVRSKRLRRLAAAVIVAANGDSLAAAADRAAALYRAWNEEHRLSTGALDLSLAAIAVSGDLDPVIALDRARVIERNLAEAGYRNEWDVARILSLDGSLETTTRFHRLASELSGRRRKPISDRRHLIAIASLADGPATELANSISHRLEVARVGRFRPDHRTRLTLAALMTLGAAKPLGLDAAFHGFVMREHYVNSYAESTSG